MTILRTPEERFSNLNDFPFQPRYLTLDDDVRMHYVDEGPSDGEVVLLLHGEPTWSYLYRKMIPVFASAGYRVIAPDLIGFGKSDKFASVKDYSYARHMNWLFQALDQLDLQGINLFCQDWGSLLGLRAVGEQPDRFSRVMVSNGFLPTARAPVPAAFKLWRAFALYSPVFPIGRIVKTGCMTKLSPQEVAAYDAPFPNAKYKAATRALPALVPTKATDPAVADNRKAWDALATFEKPFLCVFGKNDPVLGKADRALISHVAGAKDQPHERTWGGHFVQEDRGEYLATSMVNWMRR